MLIKIIKNPPRQPLQCREGFNRYTVVPGDTMFKIAQRFNVTVDFLAAENPHISDPNKIFPGDVLCVPPQVQPPGGRVPASCPVGYNRYTVVAGDTVNKIAQRLGVPPDLIIANNPHIPDPALIYPGDVLCIPEPLTFPSCTLLSRVNTALPSDTTAAAVAQKLANGNHALGLIALRLPPPSSLGDFDGYDGFVGIAGIGGFGFGLHTVTGEVPAWAGSLEIKPLLSRSNQVYIIPTNSHTGVSGQPVLQGSLP